ncbi:MAG TPA: NAD(P)H-dependent oxidoreductase [Actinocrinis sp.]|nr:NAD(P)H-dependent oxidoreductase [Actinocrinis sp.]
MAKPTLQIIVGSTRPGRVGMPVAEWFQEHAVKHGGFEAELIDLAEVNLPRCSTTAPWPCSTSWSAGQSG